MAGSPSPETAEHRARVAGMSRHRDPDDPEFVAAQQALEVSKLTEYIERVLSQAPPLTEEQRSKLSELLRPVRIHPPPEPGQARIRRRTASRHGGRDAP